MADAEHVLTEDSPRQAADEALSDRTEHPRADQSKAGMSRGSGQPGGSKGPKDKTPVIIAVVAIIGVIIAWLSYTHAQNQAAAANATNPALGTGTVAGGSTDTAALANMLTDMQTELSQLTNLQQQTQSPIPNGPTSTSNSTAPPKVGKVVGNPAPVVHSNPPPKVIKKGTAVPTARPPAAQTYTVKRGDTLSAIAARFKVGGGWQALYSKNRAVVGSNPNLIYAGEHLVIPTPPAAHAQGTRLGT